MQEEPAQTQPMTRRTLARGMVWSVPVVALAAPAPAVAASPSPALTSAGRGSWNVSWDSSYRDGYENLKFYTTVPGTVTPGRGFCVQNTKSSSQISNASVTYYVTADVALRFSPRTSTGANGGWSDLARDTSKNPQYYNGDAYLPYTTRYTGSVPAQNGTTCFPAFAFQSQNYVTTRGYFSVENSVTVDGQILTLDYDRVTMFTSS